MLFLKKSRFSFFLAVIALSFSAMACQLFVPGSISPLEVNIPLTETAPLVQPADVIVVEPGITTLPDSALDEQSALIALYARVNPAVVNIIALIRENNQLVGYSEGSGFVIDRDGNIVTNAHVVHGAEELEVTFSDSSTRPAEFIGEDFSSDLAVIRIENIPSGVTPLSIGDDNSLQVGQTVVAIGNPFGLEGTMTRGIISAVGRTIPALNTFSIPKAIQTDAPINPGNSGGPLLNLVGEVIGVNAQIRTESENRSNSGVGFAIPSSLVKRVVPALIGDGSYTWPWLGVTGGDLDWVTAGAMGLPVDRGAYISQAIEDGPSAKAGLQGSTGTATYQGRDTEVGGDVIIAINGKPIYSFDDLLIYVALETSPGDDITVTILRDNQEQQLVITLEPRPQALTAPIFEEQTP
jgi:S1-C subfamily serine protease